MDQTLWFSIGAIIALLVASAFFSGSETSITGASSARMHLLARDGNSRAATVERLREEKEKVIGAILLGNNLVNILAASLATRVLIQIFGEAGVVYATLVMTLMILIFSEVLPKTFALKHADRMALAIAPALLVLVRVLSPPTRVVQAVVRGTMHLFGERDRPEGEDEAQQEELRGAIELHRARERGDREVRDERRMLRSILDLADVEVEEIMTHRRNMVMINADLPADEIVNEVLASPYTRLPLWQNDPDNLVGVLHAKAMLRAVQAVGGDMSAIDVMSVATTPWFIPDATTLLDQLSAFRRRREHFALVVDEYGALMGIVTLEDILEEIVGDISDEHDVAVPGVRPQGGGAYIVAGNVTLRDLNREFEWNLPDEEASTLAGLIMYEARTIPDPGQTFEFHGFRFQVLRRVRNQITSIRVTPARNDEEQKDH